MLLCCNLLKSALWCHNTHCKYSNYTSPATTTEHNPHKDFNQQYTTRGHSTDLILQNNNVGHLFYLSGDLSHYWLHSLLKTPYNKYKSLQTTVTTNTSTVSRLTMALPLIKWPGNHKSVNQAQELQGFVGRKTFTNFLHSNV